MVSIVGKRVLVVEDEGIAALALCDALELAGAQIVGPAATVPRAKDIAATSAIDVAVLDVNLSGQMSYEVAAVLRSRAVPLVFVTGYSTRSLPPELAHYPILTKPVSGTEIRLALEAALDVP